MASRHPIFSFLFFPGLGHKWSRDTDIWFLTLQENEGYRFFRDCQILEGSDEFSQSYDHYKILCKLASGHALTCLSLNIDKVLITKEGKIIIHCSCKLEYITSQKNQYPTKQAKQSIRFKLNTLNSLEQNPSWYFFLWLFFLYDVETRLATTQNVKI